MPLLPALCLAAIGITALIIAWNWKVHHSRVPVEAQARSLAASPVSQPTTAPALLPAAVEPEPTQTGLSEQTQVSPSSSAAKESSPGTIPKQADTAGSPQASAVSMTSTASAPPKLQSIIYHPKRPSAMIDGKVLFVGDKLRDLRVIAITPTGATLASPSGTNHLEL